MSMNENIPDLKIERMSDQHGALILLEQDSGGNIDRVAIHPVHLRYMAETCGLVPTSDPEGAKRIATLERRIRLLQERIEHLHEWLGKQIERGHADLLEYEVTYSRATVDLVGEFCAEMEATQ